MGPSQTEELAARVAVATGAREAVPGECLQQLWAGYGEIRRFALRGAEVPSVVAKVIDVDAAGAIPDHPRGWSTDRSHARKLRSYGVEARFYETAAGRSSGARTARAFSVDTGRMPWLLVLEDLDASGFDGRRHQLAGVALDPCLRWLARFHAAHLDAPPTGLWEQGTYWHLATRPDEWQAMPARHPLREAAHALDAALRGCPHQTLVHGDAKVANFCFEPGGEVAAVDFQYVGRGSGIQDVAYFFASCLDVEALEADAGRHLDRYFTFLAHAMAEAGRGDRAAAVERDWRHLYPLAWADYCRFLVGWSRDGKHRRLHRYAQVQVDVALQMLA